MTTNTTPAPVATDSKDQAATLPLFQNKHVLSGAFPNAFTSHYLADRENGRPVVSLIETNAGITMSPSKENDVWMKSTFQGLAKPDVAPELLAKGRKDFGVDSNDELLKMRTVGCGTDVILALSDGLFFAGIKRTAAKTTDNGSVNPDAYTRPAGGSMGDIDDSALSELSEELFIVAKVAGRNTAIHIIPEDYQVAAGRERAIMDERRERFPHILAAHGQEGLSLSNHFEARTPSLIIPGMTEDVVERTAAGDKILKNRVFVDSPKQMDVNGIDGVTVLHVPYIASTDIVGVYDGEVNQKGELLKRDCKLYPLQQMADDVTSGTITMSPTPKRVVDGKDDVIKAMHKQLGI